MNYKKIGIWICGLLVFIGIALILLSIFIKRIGFREYENISVLLGGFLFVFGYSGLGFLTEKKEEVNEPI